MNGEFYIYTHIRPDTNQVFYVGKGREKRAYSKYSRNKHWNNIVNKAGGFEVQILAENLIESLAFELEVQLIKRFRDSGFKLCNMTDGGEGTSGRKRSEESKRKLSEKVKGENHPMYGKKLSQEHIKKAAEAHQKRIIQYTKDNIFITEYESVKKASEETYTNSSTISQCCKNKRRSAGGYIWRYAA